ncbi:MAG TPA: hypothetical protein VFO59_07620 [Dehalococcoidia bacterium]|nr:hypothetical protein [Dehalococcoidia bacterium]
MMVGIVQPVESLRRRDPLSIALPLTAGIFAGLALIGLYLGLVTWAQDYGHARDLLWDDRYYVAPIAAGFGLQAGLFVYLRRLLSLRSRACATAGTAAGTGTSTAAMLACCAHHVSDALPVLGLSGVAIFLGDYRVPLMAAGIAVNVVGVLFMLRLVFRESRSGTKEEHCSAVH